MATKITVDIGKTNDLLGEIEGAVYDELDKHGYVDSGYITVTLTYSQNPSDKIKYCLCGERGEYLIGKRWFCKDCLDYGGDEELT